MPSARAPTSWRRSRADSCSNTQHSPGLLVVREAPRTSLQSLGHRGAEHAAPHRPSAARAAGGRCRAPALRRQPPRAPRFPRRLGLIAPSRALQRRPACQALPRLARGSGPCRWAARAPVGRVGRRGEHLHAPDSDRLMASERTRPSASSSGRTSAVTSSKLLDTPAKAAAACAAACEQAGSGGARAPK